MINLLKLRFFITSQSFQNYILNTQYTQIVTNFVLFNSDPDAMYKSKEADKFMLKYADKFVNLLKEVNDKVCGKKMTQIYQKIPEWKEEKKTIP